MSKFSKKSSDYKDRAKAIRTLEILREDLKRRARGSLLDFTKYINLQYKDNWHHREIASTLDKFFTDEDFNRLMIFMPPQHGKSELASRNFPAYVLGRSPDTRIVGASYSSDLAKSFNRDIKRIIDNPFYLDIFPNTRLNSKNTVTDDKRGYLRNTEEFEVVGYMGSYKSVGVLGALSGRPVDLLIIDDPVKDKIEASSPTYRRRVWEWYVNVAENRLHNNSKVIIIMTRWHEDDLAGRLLGKEPEKWHVLKIEAIKEAKVKEVAPGKMPVPVNDPRKEGEALWPEKHSLQRLLDRRALGIEDFNCTHQQNPASEEEGIVKRSWFTFEQHAPDLVWDFWLDGAYTKSSANSPTGIVVAGYDKVTGKVYIRHATSQHMEMPELLSFLPNYLKQHGHSPKSRLYIEPKATGLTLAQLIRSSPELRFISPVSIKSKLVSEGKEARISVAAPKIESARVVLLPGGWADDFITQLCRFPRAANTEYVDLIGYISDFYFLKQGAKRGVRRRN